MRQVFQMLSWICLAGTILPSALYLAGAIDLARSKEILLAATIGWFVCAPLWMGRKPAEENS